jgi:excinuclease ABC subunit A
VDKGTTVIVIEHNLDVIKSADWIVDMGPEGGSGGGTVIAEGTPEQVAADVDSHTGQFLAPVLAGHPPVPVADAPARADEAPGPTRAASTKGRATKSGTPRRTTSRARSKTSSTPTRKSA